MSKPNTKCRVCGKEYFCCSDSKKINSWRTMACSFECFQEYMNRIEKSRIPVMNANEETENSENIGISKTKNKKKKITDSKTFSENIIIEN